MELECFTLLDPDTLFLYLLARFRNSRPKICAPKLHNLYETECLPLLSDNEGKPVAFDVDGSTKQEKQFRLVLESNLSLYLKNSLYSEEGNLWTTLVGDDIYRNVGMLYRMYAEHKFIRKSILLQSGEITGENPLKDFEKELIEACLEDLALVETMLWESQRASGDQVQRCDYLSQKPCRTDALLASFLLPLSLEKETEISKYINNSRILSDYIHTFRSNFLQDFEIFCPKEDETGNSVNWRRITQSVMILGALYMVVIPRLKR